jgi:spermidine synthase
MLNNAKKLSVFLLLTAFIEGAAVMAIEILGAKLIAPFYGASLYVWSATLAITLSALAVGYFLGAIISDKFEEINILFYILMVAGLMTGLMNKIAFWIMSETINLDIKTGSVLSLLFFIFIPLMLLGTSSPIIINQLSKINGKAGKNAGLVYAISTVGGVISTFSVGFYFISNYGVKMSCIFTALLLVLAPILFFIFIKKKSSALVTFAIIGCIILSNSSVLFKPIVSYSKDVNLLYRNDGLLGTLCVYDIGNDKRMLTVNNTSQTAYHIPTQKGLWEYVHRIATYSSLKPKGSKTLICGLGGGVLVNEFKNLDFDVDVCDFDSRMEFVAKKYFHLADKCNIYIDDARHFIKKSKKKYDIVVLDLSFGENVPSNVFTQECFKEIKALLNEDGFVFLHYVNEGGNKNNPVVDAIGNTLISADFNVNLLNTASNNKKSQECMFFATTKKINLELYSYIRTSAFTDTVFYIPKNKDVYFLKSFKDGIILTDDKPLMEMLHGSTALKMRSNSQISLSKEQVLEQSFLY